MSADPPIPEELCQQIAPAAQAAIRALIQRYERRLAHLEARLKQNSTNSSKPPSSDPPVLKHSPPKPLSRNKAGGQHGHAKVQRTVLDLPDAFHECKRIARTRCCETTRNRCVIRWTCRPCAPASPSITATVSFVLAGV